MILLTTAENIYCGVTLAKVCLQVMGFFKSDFFPRCSFRAVSQNLWYNFLLFAGCKAKKNGHFSQDTHSQSPLFRVQLNWNRCWTDNDRTWLQQTPSSSEKSRFPDRETGEAVNFGIFGRGALDADWSLGVSIFTTRHEDTHISWGRCALKHLFTAAKKLLFQMLSKEVERLLSCDLDVKNGIWRSLICSPRENRFFYWSYRGDWIRGLKVAFCFLRSWAVLALPCTNSFWLPGSHMWAGK